jgi:hypothetical protein
VTPPEEAEGKEDNAAAYAQGALSLSFECSRKLGQCHA